MLPRLAVLVARGLLAKRGGLRAREGPSRRGDADDERGDGQATAENEGGHGLTLPGLADVAKMAPSF